jgi:cell division protein FtsL
VKRIHIVLLLAVVSSALFLVRVAYDGRRLYAQLDGAKNQQTRLDEEFRRLDAERQERATNLRVEGVARNKLSMRSATPAVTHYVLDAPAEGVSR